MVFASGPGPYVGIPLSNATVADLLMQSTTALSCAILLLIGLLAMRIAFRTDGWRFWRRKTVLFVVAMALLAFAFAQQAWSLHQSFIQGGLSPDATYRDVYTRVGDTAADHLDKAVGTFTLWSVLLVFATLALLCVVGKHLVTSLRAQRSR